MTNNDNTVKIPDNYTELLAELRKQDSWEAADKDQGFIKLHAAMRRCLRQILWDMDIPNNLGESDVAIIENLIRGIEKLKNNQKQVNQMAEMADEIYCNWLGISVNRSKIGKGCKSGIQDNKCMVCERSHQITEMGVKPEDLVVNLKGM